MKMFLTRLGVNSRAVITGDKTQIDLPKREESGLTQIERILPGIEGIAFHYSHRRRRRPAPAGARHHQGVRRRRGRRRDGPLVVAVAREGGRSAVSAARIAEVARVALRAEKVRHAMISITLVTPRRIAALNRRHLEHAGATDVISFGFRRAPVAAQSSRTSTSRRPWRGANARASASESARSWCASWCTACCTRSVTITPMVNRGCGHRCGAGRKRWSDAP